MAAAQSPTFSGAGSWSRMDFPESGPGVLEKWLSKGDFLPEHMIQISARAILDPAQADEGVQPLRSPVLAFPIETEPNHAFVCLCIGLWTLPSPTLSGEPGRQEAQERAMCLLSSFLSKSDVF